MTETKTKRPLPVKCEGFFGVFRRDSTKGRPPAFQVRVAVPGRGALYGGSYETSGKAAEAYDNIVEHFLANLPKGFKWRPSLNYPGKSNPPLASHKACEMLPAFLAACEKVTQSNTATSATPGTNTPRRGRPPVRPLLAFNLLTLRDCLMFFTKIEPRGEKKFANEFRETLFTFHAALQSLMKAHRVNVGDKTPPNPELAEFEARIAALAREERIRDGLAELQGGSLNTFGPSAAPLPPGVPVKFVPNAPVFPVTLPTPAQNPGCTPPGTLVDVPPSIVTCAPPGELKTITPDTLT